MDIPVYLFVGFLEAGKTKFVQGTLEDKRFNNGEKTLLLMCEEGMEEYEPDSFSGKNVYVHTLESMDELNEKTLSSLHKKYKFERVVVEYNGMWPMAALFENMPKNWVVYQCMMFADASTFNGYNANMRSLVVDKINCTEVVIFNRCDENTDKMQLHKIVRGVTRRADIAYEYADGNVEYDDIEDPLPFDVNADVITIADTDYALWYRDIMEDLQKYNGKTVCFKGIAARDRRMPADSFAIGRHIMTCCVEDITYGGVVCKYENAKNMINTGDWFTVTAEIKIEKDELYRQMGPVLYVSSLDKADEPEQKVATFY